MPEGGEFSLNLVPQLNEVTAAYQSIRAHNQSHTGLAANLTAHFEAAREGGDLSYDAEQARVEGDMHAELQDILHSDLFTRIGIRIAPMGQRLVGPEGSGSTELIPLVENTTLFTDFLASLQPDNLQHADELLLNDVVRSLESLTGGYFDPEKRHGLSPQEAQLWTEAGEDALRTFLELHPEYVRLGLDDVAFGERSHMISSGLQAFLPTLRAGGRTIPPELGDEYRQFRADTTARLTYQMMRQRIDYWGRDLLPECITAQNGQYLTAPAEQRHGPSQWHLDGEHQNWAQALAFVAELEREPRTAPFAHEVRTALLASLRAAIGDIDFATEQLYFSGQRDDLVNLQRALSGQPHDQNRLQAYIG